MKYIVGARLQQFNEEGSMGVVTDTCYINCFWPFLDHPVNIFADGSSGIQVMGRTPRNVWFPDGVEFLTYCPDAFYQADLAVKSAFPEVTAMVELTEDKSQLWFDAYMATVEDLPETCAVVETARDKNFLVDRQDSDQHSDFIITELAPEEALSFMSGEISLKDLKKSKDSQVISENNLGET